MLKALVPVDGSPNSLRVVEHVIELVRGREPMEIVLLNVQEPTEAWEVRSFLKPEELAAMQVAKGGDALAPARARLDAAGILCTPRVEIGPVAGTIARIARELGCNKIVMGTHGHSAIENLLLGSVATEVIRLTDVPVTLVK